MKALKYCVCALLTCGAIGCGSDSDDNASTEAPSNVVSACPSEAGDGCVSQTVTIIDWASGAAAADVNVCWAVNDGAEACASTDVMGVATGTVPVTAGDTIHLSGAKTGFYPFRTLYVVSENPTDTSVNWSLVADGVVDLLTTELGAAADPEKGHVTALVLAPNADGGGDPIEGAEVKMIEGQAAQGPSYTNQPDQVASAGLFAAEPGTTSSGIVVFNNVDVGTAKLEVTVEGKTCTATAGTPAGDNMVEATIVKAEVTYTVFSCE